MKRCSETENGASLNPDSLTPYNRGGKVRVMDGTATFKGNAKVVMKSVMTKSKFVEVKNTRH